MLDVNGSSVTSPNLIDDFTSKEVIFQKSEFATPISLTFEKMASRRGNKSMILETIVESLGINVTTGFMSWMIYALN